MPPRRALAAIATSALLAATALLPNAVANEGSTLDSIEVTGARISYRDLLDTPAISITKRGDYLSQTITLVNDTRDEAGRRREIKSTIEKIIARAGNTYTLQHGDTYPITLSRANAEVELQDDSKRPDVSRVELQVKLTLSDTTTDGTAQIRSLRQFIEDTPKIGRTEIDLSDDTALGMNKPERYRYELIEAIAADSLKIRESIGAGCKVDLDGLNSRIEWERVGPIELLLYVPYTMVVRGCAGVNH
ncbi:MAG: hypothetical protein ACT4NL_15830 [Pseudomarimonas sp.]